MRRLAAALAVVSALCAPGSAPRAATAKSAKEIEALVQAGKLDEAIDDARAAVGARPDDVDTRLAAARALSAKARRFNHVVNVKVSEKDIEKGEIHVPNANLGDTPLQVGYDAGLFEEALVHLDAGIARAPKRQDVRVLKCFLLTDAGRIDRAKAAIGDALAALPRIPATAKTFASYGVERAKHDDLAGAATLLAPVASAFPSDANVQSDYGNILTRLGRKTEAYAAFDRAVASAPTDIRAARTRAVSAMLLRDYPRARSAFESVFRAGRGASDQFAAAAAAYGVDPKGSLSLMQELAVPAAGADPAMTELAHLYTLASSAGPGSEAAMSLGRKLVSSQQLLIAIPVLDRASKDPKRGAEARKLLAQTYKDLGCEALGKTIR